MLRLDVGKLDELQIAALLSAVDGANDVLESIGQRVSCGAEGSMFFVLYDAPLALFFLGQLFSLCVYAEKAEIPISSIIEKVF